MDDAERARGARLLARIPRDAEHGAWTFAPWVDADAAVGVVRGADGGNVAAVYPDRDLAMWDAEEARAVVWLVNHAGALLADSAELAACRATLAWYAATDDADRAADQGRRAREALRAAGRGDAIAAAEAAIGKERDAG